MSASGIIRVIYELDALPGRSQDLERAWRRLVATHRGDGALSSVFLRDPSLPNRFVAISRWESQRAWEEGVRDEADPQGYLLFRQSCEVVSRRMLHEIDHIEE